MSGRNIFLVAIALLVVASLAQAGGKSQPTSDGRTYIWNNYPKPGDEASWSGRTDSAGYASGDGILTWYKHGVRVSRYSGKMINGKFDGPVTNEDANGQKFRGTFVHGVKSADWTQIYDVPSSYSTPTITYSVPPTTFAPASASPAQQDGSEYFNRGLAELQANKFEEALRDLSKAIELNPKNSKAYINRGIVQSALGSAPGAEADFTQAITLDPKSSDAFYNRGKVRNDMTDFDGALEDYNKAIELNPRDSSAYNNRGLILGGKGALTEANGDFTRAIELDPNYGDAYFHRAQVRIARGEKEAALADLTKTIKLNPGAAEAYSDRGGLYDERRDSANALADLNRAIELNPDLANAHLNRGLVEYRQGDLKRAFDDFSKTIELKPDLAEAYQNRGVVRDALGDKEGGLNDSAKAAQLRAIKNKAPSPFDSTGTDFPSKLTAVPSIAPIGEFFGPPVPESVRKGLAEFLGERRFDYQGRKIQLAKARLFELTNKVAKVTKSEPDAKGDRSLTVSMTSEGAEQLAEFTAKNQGHEVGMLINDGLFFVATIRSALSTEFIVSEIGSEREADELVSQAKKAIKKQGLLGINFPLDDSLIDLVIWIGPLVLICVAFAFLARRRRFKIISQARIAGDRETSGKQLG